MKKEVPAAGASLLLQQGLLRQKEWCTGGIYVKILRRARGSRVKVFGGIRMREFADAGIAGAGCTVLLAEELPKGCCAVWVWGGGIVFLSL